MIDVAATIGGLAAQQFALYSDSWAIWTYLLLSQWRSSPIQTAGHELISPIVLTALVWIPSELQTTEYNLAIFGAIIRNKSMGPLLSNVKIFLHLEM